MRRFPFLVLLLSMCAVAVTVVPAINAQSIGAANCASLKDAEKNPSQQVLSRAYLQGYANASSSDPRYTKGDAALADDARIRALSYVNR